MRDEEQGNEGAAQGLGEPGEQGVCTGPQRLRTERVEVVEQGRGIWRSCSRLPHMKYCRGKGKGRKGPPRMSSRGKPPGW